MATSIQIINGIKRFNRYTFGSLPLERLAIPIAQFLLGERSPLRESHGFRITHG